VTCPGKFERPHCTVLQNAGSYMPNHWRRKKAKKKKKVFIVKET